MSVFCCRNCKEEKPIDNFCKDKSRKRGHHPYCKDCQREIKGRNRPLNIKRATNWNKKNRERRNKNNRRNYAIKNNLFSESFLNEHREVICFLRIYLYELSRKKRKDYEKKWRKENKELKRLWSSKRRALRKEKDDGTVTKESLKKKNKGNCYICGVSFKDLKDKDIHLEHVIPLSRGGLHSIHNMEFSCKSCNLKKGNKTYDEYINYLNKINKYV